MSLPEAVDSMGVKITVYAAQALLTPPQLDTCLRAAGFDIAVITATTALNQNTIPVQQLISFHQAIARTCGEPILRLLFNNLRTISAQEVERLPKIIMIKGQYRNLPVRTQAENCLGVSCADNSCGSQLSGNGPGRMHL